jgi:glycosyltransferase involved in cell wall biosynthesis
MRNNHFKIIVPSYNNEKWIKSCIRSVKKQNYQNYECIIIDDCSTDNSVQIIKQEIKDDNKFTFIQNKNRKLALENIYESISSSQPNDEDIVVTLDGDDFFYGSEVLNYVNDVYEQHGCLVTYGSYVHYPSGERGKFSKKIPDQIINNNSFRESAWMSSHMRTFKIKLWNKIEKSDLLESDGRFCDGAWDMVFMFPMLEMAGHRSYFIDQILYVYNRSNPLNEDKVNHRKIIESEMRIRKMKKYERIKI